MSPILIVALVVIALIVIATMLMFNGLVRQRNRVDETWAQIGVALKRRHDLIPNLVNAVKGYMGFEQSVLTKVTEARANAVAATGQGPSERAVAEGQVTASLRSLFAVVENYPDLKANQNVLSLQGQLATSENVIAGARDVYNAAVRSYNTAIATFPAVLMAGMMGFHGRAFFAAEPEAAQTPEVRLT